MRCIRKLNHTGTHPAHTDLAINAAIDAHERIGIARKEARLRYLQRYWTDQVRDVPSCAKARTIPPATIPPSTAPSIIHA